MKILRYMGRYPVIPVFVLLVMVFSGILAQWIAPHDPELARVRVRIQPPAWVGPEISSKLVVEEPEIGRRHTQIALAEALELDADARVGDTIDVVIKVGGSSEYLLGTDGLGRDILSRILYGARISLIVAVVTLGIGGTLGTTLGLLAGWYGGVVDEVIMRLVDIMLAIPVILIALVFVVALEPSFKIIILVLALTIWPRFARLIRAEVLSLKTMDYVALAQVAGASTPRIVFKHLFPGVVNTLIVLASLQVGIVILLESTLSFLGAGVPAPTPAWGSMVDHGRDRVAIGWWISAMPGIAIMLTVLSLNLLGDWLRDALDPRLRQIE